jgi:hypothetical protein
MDVERGLHAVDVNPEQTPLLSQQSTRPGKEPIIVDGEEGRDDS